MYVVIAISEDIADRIFIVVAALDDHGILESGREFPQGLFSSGDDLSPWLGVGDMIEHESKVCLLCR